MSAWSVPLVVRAWAARAPGLDTADGWTAWAAAPSLPTGALTASVDHLPAGVRRRIDPLGRAVIAVALEASGGRSLPVVLGSRHASLGRTLELLNDLAAGQPLSPTGFALSVHNAAVSTWTITQGDRSPHTAVSAGPTTAEAAVLEAHLLLSEGADEVLVIVADEALPAPYAPFADDADSGFAWAWRVARSGDGTRLTLSGTSDVGAPTALPHGLEVLRLMLGAVDTLTSPDPGFPARWTRG